MTLTLSLVKLSYIDSSNIPMFIYKCIQLSKVSLLSYVTIGKPRKKSSFFSGPTTMRGGGNGPNTKEKETVFYL